MNELERRISEMLRCVSAASGQFNTNNHILLSAGETITFEKGDVHSFSWSIGSGASVLYGIDGTALTYTETVNISFTSTNLNVLTIQAVGGQVLINWVSK